MPSPPSRPFIPSWQRGIRSQGSKLNFITAGLTETGSTALASISKAPCNSSPLFSSFVCFSLKKQLGHFESQLSLYSSTNNCLVPTQSSADGPIPAAIQAPACSRSSACSPGETCGRWAPSRSAAGSPATSLHTVPCSEFNSNPGRKQQQLQGNGACTEVTSQVSRLEKRCLKRWSLCKR